MTCLSIVNISLGIGYYHVFEDLHSQLSLTFLCTVSLNLFLYVGSLFLLLWSESKMTVLRSCTFYYKRDFSVIWIGVDILIQIPSQAFKQCSVFMTFFNMLPSSPSAEVSKSPAAFLICSSVYHKCYSGFFLLLPSIPLRYQSNAYFQHFFLLEPIYCRGCVK